VFRQPRLKGLRKRATIARRAIRQACAAMEALGGSLPSDWQRLTSETAGPVAILAKGRRGGTIRAVSGLLPHPMTRCNPHSADFDRTNPTNAPLIFSGLPCCRITSMNSVARFGMLLVDSPSPLLATAPRISRSSQVVPAADSVRSLMYSPRQERRRAPKKWPPYGLSSAYDWTRGNASPLCSRKAFYQKRKRMPPVVAMLLRAR
jgi:hypothetical protein